MKVVTNGSKGYIIRILLHTCHLFRNSYCTFCNSYYTFCAPKHAILGHAQQQWNQEELIVARKSANALKSARPFDDVQTLVEYATTQARGRERERKVFLESQWAALIPVSISLCQTPAYAVRQHSVLGAFTCSFRSFSLRLPTMDGEAECSIKAKFHYAIQLANRELVCDLLACC